MLSDTATAFPVTTTLPDPFPWLPFSHGFFFLWLPFVFTCFWLPFPTSIPCHFLLWRFPWWRFPVTASSFLWRPFTAITLAWDYSCLISPLYYEWLPRDYHLSCHHSFFFCAGPFMEFVVLTFGQATDLNLTEITAWLRALIDTTFPEAESEAESESVSESDGLIKG